MSTQPNDLAQRYDVHQTVDFILRGSYRSVALQFPDDLLADSPAVYRLLQQQLGDKARVFILADTAYNPLGVDEVAAQHLAADCVIHYGRASLVPVHSLPAFFVLPKEPYDVLTTAQNVRQVVHEAVRSRAVSGASNGDGGCGGYPCVVVLLDQGYQYRLHELREAMSSGSGREGGEEETSPLPPLIFGHVTARSLMPQTPHRSRTTPNNNTPKTACCANTSSCCDAAAPPPPPAATATAAATAEEPPEGVSGGTPPAVAAATAACCRGIPAGGCAPLAAGCVAAQGPEGEGEAPGCLRAECAASPSHTATGAATATAIAGSIPTSTDIINSSSTTTDSNPHHAATTSCSSSTFSMAGLTWQLPTGLPRTLCLYVWVGPEGSDAHRVLQLTHAACDWLSYDPAAPHDGVRQGLSDESRRLLKRRNFMVEKARGANIVGLLVGTLGSGGFLEVISALRRSAATAGKKTYTFLMGKPNPAKLGNFPEVDVFVLVADGVGLILDSREYLAPLVTPWEAVVAFSGGHLDPGDYRMELRDVLDFERQLHQEQQQPEHPGALRVLSADPGLSVATRWSVGQHGDIVARNAAEYLALKRSFRGLEMPATGASPKAAELAVEGLSGRAAVYADEGAQAAGGPAAAW